MKDRPEGKVYIIGAGPGDPGLITIRGLQCLKRCDVVIYDQLTPLSLLSELPDSVELIYAGKEAGMHSKSQDEINRLLVDHARKGEVVGRFKGGDPFVFGRGGEEAIYLRDNGIDYEIIPGITAGIAAPESAGIPVTHRNTVTQTIFVTAHESADKETPQVDWEKLARLENSAIVGYMGVKTLPETVEKLINAGMPPSKPVAVVHRGATSRQKTVTGELSNIISAIEREKITPPAVFIIGDTVNIRDQIEWFEKRPLFGRRIVITRPADQAGSFSRYLNEMGADAILFPTIKTEPDINPELLSKALKNAGKYDWLIFTSENGVRYFISALLNSGYDIRALKNASIAAVGTGTARALREHFLLADFIPEKFTTRDLAEELTTNHEIKNKKILRVRGIPAPSTVEEILSEKGAEVDLLIVYKTVKANPIPRVKEDLIKSGADIITFTSSSTARNFVEILGEDKARELAGNSTVLSIGPMTTVTLEKLSLPVHLEAEEHTIDGIIDEILKWNENKKRG